MENPWSEIEQLHKAFCALVSAQSSSNKKRAKKLEKIMNQILEMKQEVHETTGATVYEPEFVKQPQVSELSQSFARELELCR